MTVPIEPIEEVVPTPETSACPVITTNFIPADNLDCLLSFLGLTERDEAAERRGRIGVEADAKEFGLKVYGGQLDLYSRFIAYGVSKATRQLGERERRAVVRDLLQTIGYAATAEDFHLVAIGARPRSRNLTKEQAQLPLVRAAFRRIYRRDPNFRNANENLAWNALMYRIRLSRDLERERKGISSYRSLFRKTPVTPLEWATVRVLAYIPR